MNTMKGVLSTLEGLSLEDAQYHLLRNQLRICALCSTTVQNLRPNISDYLRRDYFLRNMHEAISNFDEELSKARDRGFDDLAERFGRHLAWMRKRYDCLMKELTCCEGWSQMG